MNKYLVAFGARALASCGTTAPAYAQDVRGSVTIRVGEQPRYGNQYGYYGNQHGYYNNYQNQYYSRNAAHLYQRYFARLPSAYGNRCGLRRDLIVRDPFTDRMVCKDRRSYRAYNEEVRRLQYYRY